MDKHNTMEKACGHLIDFLGIKEQVEKFGLGEFELKLFRSEKIELKGWKLFAIVTRAQMEMELPFLLRSATSELNMYFVSSCRLESCRASERGLTPHKPFNLD